LLNSFSIGLASLLKQLTNKPALAYPNKKFSIGLASLLKQLANKPTLA